ncbi:MAG TPA: hypothetical protein VFG37_01890, partial [Planctomycetota bacterium]|nr:hypothetical protein [Planctomycetota bacterium]
MRAHALLDHSPQRRRMGDRHGEGDRPRAEEARAADRRDGARARDERVVHDQDLAAAQARPPESREVSVLARALALLAPGLREDRVSADTELVRAIAIDERKDAAGHGADRELRV